MWARRPTAPASEPADGRCVRERRRFLAGLAALALGGAAVLLPRRVRGQVPPGLPPEGLLRDASFAYVSPLLADGRESRCHGEVWYGWLDGSVVVITARTSWKARALARGLDRARVWLGDHGRWKTWWGGRNEAFRRAPHFDARVRVDASAELFERLMQLYARKYGEEFASDWEGRMRGGFASGERVLLRYLPT